VARRGQRKVVPMLVKPETELSKVHAALNDQLLTSIKQKYRPAELHDTSQDVRAHGR
jgi:hypothetical protein